MKDGIYYRILIADWIYKKMYFSKNHTPFVIGTIQEKIFKSLRKLFRNTVPWILICISLFCIYYFPVSTTESNKFANFSNKLLYSFFSIGIICFIFIYKIGKLLRRNHWT